MLQITERKSTPLLARNWISLVFLNDTGLNTKLRWLPKKCARPRYVSLRPSGLRFHHVKPMLADFAPLMKTSLRAYGCLLPTSLLRVGNGERRQLANRRSEMSFNREMKSATRNDDRTKSSELIAMNGI